MKKCRLFFAVLSAILIFVAVGCSHRETLLGEWKSVTDYGSYLTAVLNDMATDAGLIPEGTSFITLESVPCPVVFTFREDGSYSVAPLKRDVENTVSGLRDSIARAMESLLQAEADAMGNGTTSRDLVLAMQANSVEELSEQMFSDSNLADALNASAITGHYRLEGTKLYLDDKNGSGEKYVDATVILDTLTVSASHGFSAEEEPFASYPASLERIAG